MPHLISTAKWVLSKAKSVRFHRGHHREAAGILATIESSQGKTDPGLIRRCDEYAQDVLGWRGYASWLRVYSAVAGSFREGWLPDNYYGAVVIPIIQGNYGRMSGLRTLAGRLFSSEALPDIVYRINGLFVTPASEVIQPDELSALLFGNASRVVFKADSTGQGKGFRIIEKGSLEPGLARSMVNGVFQRYIEQHEVFAELTPASVATLRITTVVDHSGTAGVRACYLRLGQGTDTHVRSASHIRVPVHPESGELDAAGYLPSWLPIDRHPDTRVAFAGKTVPDFDACLSTVLRLHRSIPGVRCIGWDVTVDRTSAVHVLEWNGRFNDIKFSEATQGPCFADMGWEKLWRK